MGNLCQVLCSVKRARSSVDRGNAFALDTRAAGASVRRQRAGWESRLALTMCRTKEAERKMVVPGRLVTETMSAPTMTVQF
jgi:hypothetical protein